MADTMSRNHNGDGNNNDPPRSNNNAFTGCNGPAKKPRKPRGKAILQSTHREMNKLQGKLPVEFCAIDETWNPITQHGKHVPRVIGLTVREKVPPCYKSWALVPAHMSQKVIDRLGDFFRIEEWKMKDDWNNILEMLNKSCAGRYKEYKHRCKAKYYLKNLKPEDVSDEHWDLACELWGTPEALKQAAANRNNRAQQKNPSGTGSKNYSQQRSDLFAEGYEELSDEEDAVDGEEERIPLPQMANFFKRVGYDKIKNVWRTDSYRDSHDVLRDQMHTMITKSSLSGSGSVEASNTVPELSQKEMVDQVIVAANKVMGNTSRSWVAGVGPISRDKRTRSTETQIPPHMLQNLEGVMNMINDYLVSKGRESLIPAASSLMASDSASSTPRVTSTPRAFTLEDVDRMITWFNDERLAEGLPPFDLNVGPTTSVVPPTPTGSASVHVPPTGSATGSATVHVPPTVHVDNVNPMARKRRRLLDESIENLDGP